MPPTTVKRASHSAKPSQGGVHVKAPLGQRHFRGESAARAGGAGRAGDRKHNLGHARVSPRGPLSPTWTKGTCNSAMMGTCPDTKTLSPATSQGLRGEGSLCCFPTYLLSAAEPDSEKSLSCLTRMQSPPGAEPNPRDNSHPQPTPQPMTPGPPSLPRITPNPPPQPTMPTPGPPSLARVIPNPPHGPRHRDHPHFPAPSKGRHSPQLCCPLPWATTAAAPERRVTSCRTPPHG